MNRFIRSYRRFFAIEEIENERELHLLFAVLWVGFLLAFFEYSQAGHGSLGQGTCWPYFQSCENFKFMANLPRSYAFSFFYAIVFGILVLAAACAYSGRWLAAHAAFLAMFLWKLVLFFVLSFSIPANFEYFHLMVCAMFLFARRKLFFAQLGLVVLYFLSVTVKLGDSWIVGTYFTSLKLGMPLVPDILAPLFTNFVIFLEGILTWLLLSHSRKKRLVVVGLYCAFHLYSISMVGLRYPVYTMLPLLALFAYAPPQVPAPLRVKYLDGYAIIAVLLVLQFLPWLLFPNRDDSLEGYKLGVGMFDANHQCRSRGTLHFANGETRELASRSRAAMSRCMPYYPFMHIKKVCESEPGLARVAWTYDHSRNGGPFYRIIELENVCDRSVSYEAWASNSWIRTPGPETPVVGHPAKNHALGIDRDFEGPMISENPRIELSGLQPFLSEHRRAIAIFWSVLIGCWIAILLSPFGKRAIFNRR